MIFSPGQRTVTMDGAQAPYQLRETIMDSLLRYT